MMNVLRISMSVVAMAAVFVMAVVPYPAVAANYGRLSYNPEATEALKALNQLPGYRYYAIGFPGEPDGILAVAKGFTFASVLWKEITLDSHRGKSALLSFELATRTCGENAMAYDITDRKGRRVGFWYADSFYPIVRVGDDGALKVTVPARTRNLRGEDF